MENNKKSVDLLALERSFQHLKAKEDVDEKLAYIEKILSRRFDLNFKISIVENRTNEFFGMTIYPAESLIDTLVDSIVRKKDKLEVIEKLWAENKDWYLEIDSLLLYDRNLNANPSEMVAVLLHEVGHVVYSNSVPARVNKILRYKIMELDYGVKRLLSSSKINKLFNLVFVEACNVKNFRFSRLQHELDADRFVVKQGYGEHLDSFIEKLLRSQGNRLINRTEKDIEKDVKAIVTWTIENISELEYRKTKLRTTLQTELLKNPSKFVRQVVTSIKVAFFGGDGDSYKELLTEQYLVQEHRKIVQEGLLNLFDKFGKLKKISQSDIDIIEIEASRIENEDDKIYVLDLIYDKLDLINAGLQLINEKKQDKVPVSKDKLLNFKSQLEKLRKQVLETPINNQYGLFIKYPVGYEG